MPHSRVALGGAFFGPLRSLKTLKLNFISPPAFLISFERKWEASLRDSRFPVHPLCASFPAACFSVGVAPVVPDASAHRAGTPRIPRDCSSPHHPRRRPRHESLCQSRHSPSTRKGLGDLSQHSRALPLAARSGRLGASSSRCRSRHPSCAQ